MSASRETRLARRRSSESAARLAGVSHATGPEQNEPAGDARKLGGVEAWRTGREASAGHDPAAMPSPGAKQRRPRPVMAAARRTRGPSHFSETQGRTTADTRPRRPNPRQPNPGLLRSIRARRPSQQASACARCRCAWPTRAPRRGSCAPCSRSHRDRCDS